MAGSETGRGRGGSKGAQKGAAGSGAATKSAAHPETERDRTAADKPTDAAGQVSAPATGTTEKGGMASAGKPASKPKSRGRSSAVAAGAGVSGQSAAAGAAATGSPPATKSTARADKTPDTPHVAAPDKAGSAAGAGQKTGSQPEIAPERKTATETAGTSAMDARSDAPKAAVRPAVKAVISSSAGDGGKSDAAPSATTDKAATPDADSQSTHAGKPATPPPPASPPPASPPPAPARRGFLGPVLGGVIAAGLGAGAVLYLFPDGWQDRAGPTIPDDIVTQTALSDAVAPMEARLDTLATRLDELATADPATAAMESLEDRLAALEATEDDQRAALIAQIGALDERIKGLAEDQPESVSMADIGTALSPLSARIDRLEGRIDEAIAARVDTAIEDALSDARAAQDARAQELEAQAEALAQQSAMLDARTALAELDAAADSGEPAPQALARIGAVTEPPAALAAFAAGLATQGQLQDQFSQAARQALAAEAPPPDAGAMDRVFGFLRQQTGARSLAPRDGDDADAVLSRAEAQLRADNLAGAVETVSALAGDPAAVMAGWREAAETRLAALAALAELRARLGSE